MLPEYVRDELALRVSSPRLHPRKLKAVCRLLEIDLDAALDPSPSVEEVAQELSAHLSEAPTCTGAVPFDLEIRCGNNVRRMPGRVVYASEGLNARGEIEPTVSTCQVLAWDSDLGAPAWELMPEPALPNGLIRRLCEAVLDAVAEQQSLATLSGAD
jgi:hypothetical protein